MFPNKSSHLKAVLLALFVTVLWSSSWVLIKIGLQDIPPLTFAGLRYVWAFLVLAPVTLHSKQRRRTIRQLGFNDWYRLTLLGLVYYAATQGLIFVALGFLKATTLSLMLNFTSVVVAALGIVWLKEMPTLIQWTGILTFLTGVLVYFHPLGTDEPAVGLIAGGAVVLTNAISALLGRDINRSHQFDPMTVTFISMGMGSIGLLTVVVMTQGLPRLSLLSWVIVGWLAVVNSAFAFTLWNATQRTLSATESSVINNTMLIQIVVLAWLFLSERLTVKEIGGLVLAAAGILLVQLRHQGADNMELSKDDMSLSCLTTVGNKNTVP